GRDAIAYTRQDFSHPAELHRVDARGGTPRRLTGFNDALLRPLSLGKVESVRYAGHGGAPVQAWLVYPADHDPRRRWPVLLLAHGGPFGAWNDGFNYRWNAHVFAARGYIVALPNFHGSTGFGQAFADSILGNHGEKPAADMIAARDWLAARRDVDPARIAIAGGSYGGYLAALLTGLTDKFAASIVHAGVFDLTVQFASDSHWDRPAAYGNAPWTDPVELDRWSPSRFSPKFATPTLITHGEKDYRVPVTQGINLHGVLTGKGVPSRIVIFPDENHWILKPQASKLWYDEVGAWLDRWVEPRGKAR
ncbi:MAG TPA: S9 family peptidase, partial [Xanthomonadales bacterium]|nr:S9 family peptidase [Xanthomonadales bacterium]